MKKLISLLACAALLVGLVIAVFPAMSGSADTSIQAGGFSGAAPGTTTYKLGGAGVSGDKYQLVVGDDKTYDYKLTQDLASWVNTTVYAPDNKTPVDVREFQYLYINVVSFSAPAACTDASGNYFKEVNGNRVTVATANEAKQQEAFVADMVLQTTDGNKVKNVQRKNSSGKFENWDLLSPDIRSKGVTRIDLKELKDQIVAQNKALTTSERSTKEIDVADVLGSLRLNVLVYGKETKMELYVSNNPDFDPTPLTVEKNPTVSLGASDSKNTITKNDDGYYAVKEGKDQVVNLFAASGAGNMDASAYPYLHIKFLLNSGAKVTNAVLIDAEGNEYKAGGSSAVNILGGTIENVSSRQITFDASNMTAADKAQFLSNLRVKLTVEGGAVSMLAKVSTDGNLKITSDNVPGITTHKLTAKPGPGMPQNAAVEMDEADGSVNYNLKGHLAAWVPATLYNGAQAVNGNDYQYLIIDVKKMTDGLCRNDADTAYAKEVENADGSKTWVDADGEADAKVQTAFAASFQLTYTKNGSNQQLKKVNLDKDGNMKRKTVREDSAEFKNTKHSDKYETLTVNKDGVQTQVKAYYVLDSNGKYLVDGGDWGVAGEARQPMTHKVDFKKLAEQVAENNAALDKALKDGQISQQEHDSYYMNIKEVLKTLTVRALVYGKQVQMDYYITNNGNFTPGTIASNVEGYESVSLGISKADEYKANPNNMEAYYYLKTDSNHIKNSNKGATTMVINLYALQGEGNMDARTYDYLYLRVNTLKNGTKITSMKLMDIDGNVLPDNLLSATGGEAVAGQLMRIDLRKMSEAQREQYLENTRMQVVMDGTEANLQAAFSIDEGFTFEDYLDEDDPNYAYKLHLQPLHIEFNASDVNFRSDGSVSVNLSASGAGMHVMDRTGAIDATQYKYMYIYLESGAINDVRFRTSDNASDDDLKVQKQIAAGVGLTRVNLEQFNATKPRLMKDLCFNFVVYVSTEITGIWFSNSPTFDPIASPTESDYEIVIGQQVDPVKTGVSGVMNLDGSMEFNGKGEYHFKPITGTKGFNASSLKYLVVDIESGAEHLKELRLRNKENSKASAFTNLKNGWQYGVINDFDSKILENVYFTMVVDGKVKIRSMWFTNEPEMNPQYKALEPEYVEVDLSNESQPYLPQKTRTEGTSNTTLTVNDKGMVSASGPVNKDVGLYTSAYYDEYSNPAQAVYIKFGVVNRPTYVVMYTYDMVTTGSTTLVDVLTVNVQPGTYNDYVRIDMRDSSFYSSGFSGMLEVNIYSPAQSGSGKGTAFTLDKMVYVGTASPALSPMARTDMADFVPYDAAQLLKASDIPGLVDKWDITPDDNNGGAETGDNSMALPVSVVAVASAAAMVVVWRKRKQKVG